jgi:Leucine-rich repeat (LRR) protein
LKHFYPSEISKEIKEISINNNKILGFLKLDGEGFERLKKITIRCKNLGQIELIDLFELEDFRANPCQLTKLTIKNCPNIENLNVANNLLTKLDFLKNLGEEKNKLKFLSIHSNDFSEKDLSCFSELINLEQLYIDNCDREKFSRGKYNKFKGSLKPLKNLKKLKYLSISNTDIDSGLEYLPESIRRIGCVSK